MLKIQLLTKFNIYSVHVYTYEGMRRFTILLTSHIGIYYWEADIFAKCLLLGGEIKGGVKLYGSSYVYGENGNSLIEKHCRYSSCVLWHLHVQDRHKKSRNKGMGFVNAGFYSKMTIKFGCILISMVCTCHW